MVPAACWEEGGSGGKGTGQGGHKQGLLQKVAFPDKTVRRHKCGTVTGPAVDM